jgi:hypothetical protein
VRRPGTTKWREEHSSRPDVRGDLRGRTPVQLLAGIVGAALLLLGVAGFIPGLTTHYGELRFVGRRSHAGLLGLFRVSVLHNLVHVVLGCGALLARTARGARVFLRAGGIACLTLWLAGVIGVLDGLPVNAADNWLHLLFGLALFLVLALTSREDLGDDLERDLGR